MIGPTNEQNVVTKGMDTQGSTKSVHSENKLKLKYGC